VINRRTHRTLETIACRLPYHLGSSERFDRMAVQRKSWGYWFVAKVAIGNRKDIRA
jgi:hypothetical protein